jgi:hypothetical protein
MARNKRILWPVGKDQDYQDFANDFEFSQYPGFIDWYTAFKTSGSGLDGHYNMAQLVDRGDKLGRVGNRGFSGGPHIHLEVYEHFEDDKTTDANEGGWHRVNPLSVFESKTVDTGDWMPSAGAFDNFTPKMIDDVYIKMSLLENFDAIKDRVESAKNRCERKTECYSLNLLIPAELSLLMIQQ